MKATKLIVGLFVSIVILSIAMLAILSLWGIELISWMMVVKILISAGIVSVAALVMWMIVSLFFKKGV